MRVLIVNANRTSQPVPVLPFGACLVAQSAHRAGHDVRFLDLMFAKRPAADLAGHLVAHPCDVVGLSVRNLDTNDHTTPLALADQAADLARTVRQHSRAPLVLGGAAMGVMPRQLLHRTGADFGVPADGETVFPLLLSALADGVDPANLPGVATPNSPARPAAPSPKPPPDCTVDNFARWLDLKPYLARMTAVPVQAKRGCPFDCLYCTYTFAEGQHYRLHPPARVVGAIAQLASQGLRDIEFVDNVFNSPRDHALAICRHLADAALPVRCQSLELNPRFLDDELLAAMEEANFVGIGLTVESAADPVLEALRKGFDAADVERCAGVVARHAIPCIWIFMLGGPGETPATLARTLEFASTAVRPSDTAFFQIGTRIYPGTALETLARRQGLLQAPPDDMLEPVFYFSPDVSLPWLRSQLALAARRHLNFVVGDAIRLPLLQTVLRFSYRLGLRPPLWRHTAAVRRVLNCLGLYRPTP